MSETREERDKRHEKVQERLNLLSIDMTDAQSRIQGYFQKMVIVAPMVLNNQDPGEDEERKEKIARMIKALKGTDQFLKLCREHADDFIRMGQILRRYADLGEPHIQEVREDARADGLDLGDPT